MIGMYGDVIIDKDEVEHSPCYESLFVITFIEVWVGVIDGL